MKIARGLRPFWPPRPADRARERRASLYDAFPGRRDRRELRRRFRRVARAVRREGRAETTAALQRLSASHVLLASLVPGSQDNDIAEFTDGTRLLVGLFIAKADIERLGLRAARYPVWLEQVQPCFGRRRYWLWVASADRMVPLEVLASVQLLVSARPE